ncbi:MAG: hypothetical protein D6765_02590 [Bacteroidetes bacterium]|nr:MAG: hypothetical protein D6765_02590 [Bacteroidota bacterium]
MPPRETALSLLSRVLVELQSQPFPARLPPPIRRMFAYAAPEMRFPYNLLMANLWCTEGLLLRQLDQTPATAAMIRTTAAPTRMQAGFKDNVLPTRATASVNLRLLPGETTASAVERVRRIADDPRLRISLSDSLHSADPPPLAEIESFGYQTLERSIREVFPETVVLPWLLVATTDSRHFAPLTDNILRFQPLLLTREDTPRFHGIDERIAEDNYLQMIRFYRQLLLNSSR